MKKLTFSTVLVLLFTMSVVAQQFNLSAELRPRFENKHGYKTLMQTGAEGNSFVSQRTRLNFNFKQEKLIVGVSLQNVRVWGDVSTLSSNDKASNLHEAWAEAILSDNFSLKFGRQEIVYDDSRIFGNVGWAQQGRSHDAMIAKFKLAGKDKLNIGFALNADNQAGVDNLYSNAAGYKTFQYAWYNTKINKLGLSLLLLNNGVEYDKFGEQTVDYSQTYGTRLTYKHKKFMADFATYYQGGKLKNNDISASYFTGNLKFKPAAGFLIGAGVEYLSGKDSNDTDTKIKSFVPLYGTNHKFNGWMDYFYVGNHVGSVGLLDVNWVVAYKSGKFSAKVIPHFFSSAANIYNGTTKMDKKLGTEIDVNLGYKIAKSTQFNIGFSKMYATKSMEVLKGGDKNENNAWAWVMFTFKPTLFSK